MGRTMPVGGALWWLAMAMVAIALVLLVSACGAENRRANPAATATPGPSPAPSASPASPAPPSDEPSRWGYDPSELTGRRDPPIWYAALPAGYRIETFVSGLERPTSLAFAPDGRLLVTEQAGTIRLIADGRLRAEPFFVAEVYLPDPEDKVVELGLVGITVDPNFEQNGYVYIYYATDEPERRTVLARIRAVRGRGKDLEEIFSLEAAPDCCHIAGSLRFAPDGSLFVTVGDHQMEPESQNRGSPFGSVLRINRDGSPHPDNPFVDDEEADPRIYAYGLRNPFDLAIDTVTGRVFATENGFLGQDAVIEIKPGANYGWPGYGLAVPREQIEPPLLFYHEPIGPAGMELYGGDALPELTGTLLFCQFHRGGALHAVTFALDGSVARDSIIALGCTSDVLTGPDGLIYFVDYVGGVVYRIALDEE